MIIEAWRIKIFIEMELDEPAEGDYTHKYQNF